MSSYNTQWSHQCRNTLTLLSKLGEGLFKVNRSSIWCRIHDSF